MVATVLYNEMLGSLPNFNRGSVVAVLMLVPSVITIALLRYLEKYNIRYNRISPIEIRKNRLRDGLLGLASAAVLAVVLSVFAVIFLVPFVRSGPTRSASPPDICGACCGIKVCWACTGIHCWPRL